MQKIADIFGEFIWRTVVFRGPAFVGLLLAGCAVVDTGAGVAKAGAAVVSTAVTGGATIVSTTATVAGKAVAVTATTASAAVTAANSSRQLAVATAGTVIAAGALVHDAATRAAQADRADDVVTLSAIARSQDRVTTSDGRSWLARDCAVLSAGQSGLWVLRRNGDTLVRLGGDSSCAVTAAPDDKG